MIARHLKQKTRALRYSTDNGNTKIKLVASESVFHYLNNIPTQIDLETFKGPGTFAAKYSRKHHKTQLTKQYALLHTVINTLHLTTFVCLVALLESRNNTEK